MAKRPAIAGARRYGDANAEYEQRRREGVAWRKWYGTQRWRRIARAQLVASPICVMCQREGVITAATVADHVEAHRGDATKFWCGELQSLCASHHNRDKQAQERAP